MIKVLLCFASFFSLPTVLLADTIHKKMIAVHGHRGARARLPENTLPAFDYALKVGVDVLELDLGVSKDGVLVISHDQHINKNLCLDGNGKRLEKEVLIHSLTLQEIKSFDCGTLKNKRFPKQQPIPGIRIPTLDEFFEMVKTSSHPAAQKVQFNIETKIKEDKPDATVGPETFTKLVVETLQKHQMVERSILQSFDFRTLAAAKQMEPKLRRSALFEPSHAISAIINYFNRDYIQDTLSIEPHFLSPNYERITSKEVSKLHSKGIQVAPWTANTVSDWEQLIEKNVDAIITDDPEALIEYLTQKGLRS